MHTAGEVPGAALGGGILELDDGRVHLGGQQGQVGYAMPGGRARDGGAGARPVAQL